MKSFCPTCGKPNDKDSIFWYNELRYCSVFCKYLAKHQNQVQNPYKTVTK